MGKKMKEKFTIEDLLILDAGAEGVCIGKYEERVVFVNNVVPGDVVDVEVYKKKHHYYMARLLQLKVPSEKRVEPKCEHFGICGGCKWQNMDYQAQLFYKQKQVQDHFERIGKFSFPPLKPILPSDNIFQYRNKIEYTFSNRRWLFNEEMEHADELNLNGLGFHLPGVFDKVLDINHCDLHSEIGNQIRNSLREFALKNSISFYNIRTHEGLLRNVVIRNSVCGDLMVIVVFAYKDKFLEMVMNFLRVTFPQITSLMYVVNDKMNDSIADLEVHTFFGNDFMTEQMEDLQFHVAPQAFYQTNASQALKLYQTVRTFANIQPEDIVYDLYTGTGTIALFVARLAKKVVAVEYVDSAVENAKENAILNHIDNAVFYVGDMAKVFTDDFIAKNGKPDILIADPPRNGMHPDVVAQILKIMPKRIVYVSCNPATQARDIALLSSAYQVIATQPVDMFPHTQHVENVCMLEKL